MSRAEITRLQSVLPQLVARGAISASDAAALEKLIQSAGSADIDGGQALLRKALDTADRLRQSGVDLTRDPGRVDAVVPSRESREARTSDRSAGSRSVDDVVLKASGGSLQSSDFEFLARATGAADGARNLADALEWMMSQPNGGQRMVDILRQGCLPGSTTYLAQALANMGQASPEQTLGLLLLTTDARGGAAELVRFFGAMSGRAQAAGQFATMFEGLTRSSAAAGAMAELLETLTSASFEDRSGSKTMARLLNESSAGASGAANLNKGFGRTLEVEGGARAFARILQRLSSGAEDTADFLEHLGSRESGGESVGRLLARASASRDGARQVLDSFVRMADAEGGREKTGEILARAIESHSGARLVANLTTESLTAKTFEALLSRLDSASTPETSTRLTSAFEKMQTHPDAAQLRLRSADSPELGSILERFTAPRADASAQARLSDAVMQSRQAGDARLEASHATVHAELSRSAATEAGTTRTHAQAASGGQGGGLEHLSSGERQARSTQVVQGSGQQQGGGGQGGGGQQGRGESGGGFQTAVLAHKGTRKIRAVESVHDVEETSETKPGAGKTSTRFRPGDVYSKSTLLAARICGECGFRLTPSGHCVRCEEMWRREVAVTQTQRVRAI